MSQCGIRQGAKHQFQDKNMEPTKVVLPVILQEQSNSDLPLQPKYPGD